MLHVNGSFNAGDEQNKLDLSEMIQCFPRAEHLHHYIINTTAITSNNGRTGRFIWKHKGETCHGLQAPLMNTDKTLNHDRLHENSWKNWIHSALFFFCWLSVTKHFQIELILWSQNCWLRIMYFKFTYLKLFWLWLELLVGGAGLHQQRMEQCDLPSTLMTPSRCSILMAPQHNRMMAMVCKLLSRCSLSIPTTVLMPLNLGDFELWNNLSWNVQTSFSASLSSSWCPEALSPFYILLYS